MTTILNAVASELEDLSATHYVCAAFGATFTATNLLLGYNQDLDWDTVTITPYGGSSPDTDGYRQNPYVQVMMQSTREKCIEAHQQLINYLHMNGLSGKGVMYALSSAPLVIDTQEGGKWAISTSNYSIKHVKI